MESINSKMIDDSEDYVDEGEMYDKLISFINNGGELNKNETLMIRSYFINCIRSDKTCFYLNISDYVNDLVDFIVDKDTKKKEDDYYKNKFDKIQKELDEIKDDIYVFKKSKVLSEYVLNTKELSLNIDKICNSILLETKDNNIKSISIINKDYYSNDLYTIISYEFLAKYFKAISKYNKICLEFSNLIEFIYLKEEK